MPQAVHQRQNYVPGVQGQTGGSKNNYQPATPIASLQQHPAPVDCPICGVREVIRTEYVSGGTTQYVIHPRFSPSSLPF